MNAKLMLGSLLLLTVLVPVASADSGDERADVAGCLGDYTNDVDAATDWYTLHLLNDPLAINPTIALTASYALGLVTVTGQFINCVGFIPTQ